MRILFDQGAPAPLRQHLSGQEVATAYETGWSTMKNGQLLEAAEAAGFAAFVTTDMNFRYQHNLGQRLIALVVLNTTSWPRIRAASVQVLQAVARARPGSYEEILIP